MAWVENLFFEAADFKLDVARWDFPDEGVTCVWGASGAGKSTLLQLLAGLIECPRLKLSVKDELISELPLRERNLGFVFQDFALFPHMTAWENVSFAAEGKNLPKAGWTDHAHELMERLGLRRIKDHRALHLSGGEKQRVALARALVTKPRMVLLDEPLSALDERIKFTARELIVDLSQVYKVPFVFVTHDLRDVRLSRSVLVLDDGIKKGEGETVGVLDDPHTLDLAALIPENQVLNVRYEGGRYFLAEKELHLTRVKKSHHLALLAKDWTFSVTQGNPLQGLPFLQGTIAKIFDEGASLICMVRLTDGQSLKATASPRLNAVRAGQTVNLSVDESQLILFKP